MKLKYFKTLVLSITAVTLCTTSALITESSIRKNSLNSFYLNESKNTKYLNNQIENINEACPKVNDIYNDLVFDSGFININNSSISFYNWFFVKIWSFDVDKNLSELFEIHKSIDSIKVKSVNDNNLVVYGNLKNSKNNKQSYIFLLNLYDGTIIKKNNKNGILSDGLNLINEINLITVVDNELIATPKKSYIGKLNNAKGNILTFSIIDLNTYLVSSKTFDLGWFGNEHEFGEVIAVQKFNDRYIFANKAISASNNKYSVSVYLILFDKNATVSNTRNWRCTFTSENSTKPDLDKAFFSVFKKRLNSEEKMFITMNYDTTSWTLKPIKNNFHSPLILPSSINENEITTNDVSQDIIDHNLKVVEDDGTQKGDNIAGVTNFIFDELTSKTCAVVAHKTDKSKFAFVPLESKASVAPKWINLNGFSSSNNEIIKLGFIPKTTKNNQIYGYFSVDRETNSSTKNETKIFSYLPQNTARIISNYSDYKVGLSDDEINSKYGNTWATENIKNEITKDLVFSLTVSGSIVKENLTVNTIKGTITGNVILSANNWWNNGITKFSRNVNINFKRPADYNVSFVVQDENENSKWNRVKWLKTTRKPSDITKREIIDYFIFQGKYLNLNENQIEIINGDEVLNFQAKSNNLIIAKVSDLEGTIQLNYDLSLLDIPSNSGIKPTGKIVHSGFSKESNFMSYNEYLSTNVKKSQYFIVYIFMLLAIIFMITISLLLIRQKQKNLKTKKINLNKNKN
ncbi:MAG: hypothetical protein HDR31_01955 [Mycoplasma sp.]|nr:hypothetical protein [Mycoplasma sp.]